MSAKNCFAVFVLTGAAALSLEVRELFAQAPEPLLQLEAKIPLGDVRGRIDHMTIDRNRHRLFVAELGNDTVGVVDPNARKVIHVITGLNEPQGVAYVPSSDALYVANAGDGSVRIFEAENYQPAGQIDLGEDADNIRVDNVANRVFVGYGNGALAVIDPAKRSKIGDIRLGAHPESFQLDISSTRIFVNVPKRKEIAVVDRATAKQTERWPLKSEANFPMALDEDAGHVLVAFRSPAGLGVFSARDGANITTVEACGDADDVFIDRKRQRAYVSCGTGFIDAFDMQGSAYRRVARILTTSGALTSLFVPELDRFLLAVRANAEESAAVWVFRPTP